VAGIRGVVVVTDNELVCPAEALDVEGELYKG